MLISSSKPNELHSCRAATDCPPKIANVAIFGISLTAVGACWYYIPIWGIYCYVNNQTYFTGPTQRVGYSNHQRGVVYTGYDVAVDGAWGLFWSNMRTNSTSPTQLYVVWIHVRPTDSEPNNDCGYWPKTNRLTPKSRHATAKNWRSGVVTIYGPPT